MEKFIVLQTVKHDSATEQQQQIQKFLFSCYDSGGDNFQFSSI